MEFLKGYIGLSSTLGVEAPSGLYVDALPDITTATIEKIIADEPSAVDAWEKIEWRTILKFRTFVQNEVNKCHHVNSTEKIECLIRENMSVFAIALWYLMGAEVMLTRATSSRVNVATIDRQRPKEIREEFMSQFQNELTVAVNNINIHASSCFPPENQPECKDILGIGYSIM